MILKKFSIRACVAALLMLVAFSCTNDYHLESFQFAQEGGPLEYEFDVDGASITLEADGVYAEPTCFYEDGANPGDGDWFTELEWIRVFYTPKSNRLLIRAFENSTGRERHATIKCTGNDNVIIKLTQEAS